MIIPKKFTVNEKEYRVVLVDKIAGYKAGKIGYVSKIVLVAHSPGVVKMKKYSQREKEVAFWHEALHAAFYDLGVQPKDHDEELIDGLAERIVDVCNSAKL